MVVQVADRPSTEAGSARGRSPLLRRLIVAALSLGAVAAALALTVTPGGDGSDEFGLVETPGATGRAVDARVGALAPDFRLAAAGGGPPIRLSDHRGSPVLLNFWATWCGPCRLEMPDLVLLHETFGAEGLTVLGVNIREPAGRAQDFAEELGIPFPLPLDRSGAVTDAYLKIGAPNTLLIDADGVIRAQFIGQIDAAEVQQAITTLFAGDRVAAAAD